MLQIVLCGTFLSLYFGIILLCFMTPCLCVRPTFNATHFMQTFRLLSPFSPHLVFFFFFNRMWHAGASRNRLLFKRFELTTSGVCFWLLPHRMPPEGRPGMSYVSPSVWNLRAVIWFYFAISSLVLLPSPVTLSVLAFSACWPFLLNFFQKILQYFSLRDRLFCMAPVLQLGEDSWSVVCAACCHMTLVFAIMHLYNIFKFFIASVHSFFYTS